MKSFFRIMLFSLLLVTVALISALTSMRFAIHGRQVSVPKLIGLTPDEATRTAEEFGLSLKVDRQFYSPTVPAGKIVSQTPDAGAQVRRGWRVLVAQSLGQVRVSPPDVVGQTERAATINIRRRGLEIGEGAALSVWGQNAGTVVAQSPPANSASVTSPSVSLLTTDPPAPQAYVMPNFVGVPLAAATKSLAAAHLHVGSVTSSLVAPDAAIPVGFASMVVSQTPAPGQKVQEGQPVNFEVQP